MNPLRLYFRADGRITRLQFWLGVLGVAIALVLTILVIVWAAPPLAIIVFVLWPITILVLCIKRLHDRGRSGWWVVVFVILPQILGSISDRLTDGSPIWWVLAGTACVLGVWGLIEIGFLRGTDGDNDYGPDPLAKSNYRPAPSDDVGSTPAPGV
jgi:uncharacterized membrane protein YhaH (DUF805 family)